MASRKLEVEIVGDASSLERAFGKAQKSSSKLGGALKTGVVGAAAGAGAALAGLGVAAKIGFDEFSEAEKVGAQTAAVLKSTGGAAKVTKGEIEDLAGALMRKSGVDDEAIQSGQNMLLTFTKIRNEAGKGNDIFNQATKATLDMSVAMGSDMQSASILMGKALNDPIKGVGALSKAGVQLSDSQKQMIKDMVAAGNTAGAQKIILGELETQFGGSAEAAGKTFGGQLDIAKQSLLNMAGEVVGKVIPHLTSFVTKIQSDVIPWIQGFIEKLQGGGGLGSAFDTVRRFVQDVWWPAVKAVFGVLKDTFNEVVAVLRSKEPEIRAIMDNVKTIFAGLKVVFDNVVLPILRFAFTEVLPRVIGIAIEAIAKITGAIAGIAGFITSIRDKFAAFWEWVRFKAFETAAAIIQPFSLLPGKMGGWARDAKNQVNAELEKIQTEKEIRISARIFASLSEGARNAPDNRGDGRIGALSGAADGVIDAWVASNLGSLVRSVAPPAARNPGGLSTKILDELGLAQSMGLSLTSGYRPGSITSSGRPSLHGVGQAIDVAGSAAQMAAFARAVAGRPGLAEVLYTPVGGWYPGSGWVGLSGKIAADHYDHVHVGTFHRGGVVPGVGEKLATVKGGEAILTGEQMAMLSPSSAGPTLVFERGAIQAGVLVSEAEIGAQITRILQLYANDTTGLAFQTR